MFFSVTPIESSRTVIVLISQTYVKSKVCQEEYNLASAMHSDFSYNTKLLPLLVETVADLPSWCREHTPIDCRDISDRSLVQLIKRVDAFRRKFLKAPFVHNYSFHFYSQDKNINDLCRCTSCLMIALSLKFRDAS